MSEWSYVQDRWSGISLVGNFLKTYKEYQAKKLGLKVVFPFIWNIHRRFFSLIDSEVSFNRKATGVLSFNIHHTFKTESLGIRTSQNDAVVNEFPLVVIFNYFYKHFLLQTSGCAFILWQNNHITGTDVEFNKDAVEIWPIDTFR